ncbi:hypothetical protein EC968_002416 [Mortierella alpina]|nr:hypothetical protein EC968_002416 [Mortierella alpina]
MTIYANTLQSQLNSQSDKTWPPSPSSPLTISGISIITQNPADDNIPLVTSAAEPARNASPRQSTTVVNSLEGCTMGFSPKANLPQLPQLQTFINLWNDHSVSSHVEHPSELQAHLDSTSTTPSPKPVIFEKRISSKTTRRNHRIRKIPSQTVSGSRRPSTSHKDSPKNRSSVKRSDLASPSTSSSSADPTPNSCATQSRRRLKMEETEYLLDQFERNEKPTSKERAAIAARLHLDSRTVQVWFQNRRAKLKRDDCLANHLMAEGEEKPDDQETSDRVDQDAAYGSTIECSRAITDTMDTNEFTNTACSFVQMQPSAHLGSGPGAFLGYECSYGDAGWNRLFESELAQVPNLNDLQLSTSLIGSEAFPGGHASDQFDMSTIDLVFGLDYENELLVQNAGSVGQCLEVSRPLGEEESSLLASRTELVKRPPRRQVTLSGSKLNPTAGLLRDAPMRKASVMARLHTQIPLQQMAFTLVTDHSQAGQDG